MDRIKNTKLKSFIKEVKMIEQEGRNKTLLKKSMIIDTIERKSSYFPARYNSIAQATILNKGYAILNLLRKYPDDLIRIQPFPPFIGYKSAEGIKYEDFFESINYEFINKDYEWVDEWGVKMQYKKNTVGACAVDFPLKNWDSFDKYIKNQMPKGSNSERLSAAKEQINKIESGENKYIVGDLIFFLFERAQLLRGVENFLTDLYINGKIANLLLRELTNYNLEMVEEWAKLNVNAIFMTDDWGAQNNMIISPDLWKKFFKPYYIEIFNCVHKNNMHVIFHSCGAITKIIGELIEIGIDVLHPIQPASNDYNYIAKKFGKDLTVMGGIDVQKILPNGTKDEIKESLYEFAEIFSHNGCGVIFHPTNSIVPDTPLENIELAFETIKEIKSNIQ